MNKVFLGSLLTLGLVLGIFGFQHLSSASSNETFYFDFYSGHTETEALWKDTTSSVYIRSNSMLGGSAFGAYVTKDRARMGPTKSVYLNTDTYLINYVVETYSNGANVRVQGTGGPSYASGSWRPDL